MTEAVASAKYVCTPEGSQDYVLFKAEDGDCAHVAWHPIKYENDRWLWTFNELGRGYRGAVVPECEVPEAVKDLWWKYQKKGAREAPGELDRIRQLSEKDKDVMIALGLVWNVFDRSMERAKVNERTGCARAVCERCDKKGVPTWMDGWHHYENDGSLKYPCAAAKIYDRARDGK